METFQRVGACVLRGLLEEDEIERLRQGVEQNLREPSERALEGGGGAGSGRCFEDFRNWTRIAPYEEVIRWHQDQPFYNLDGHATVSFWIRLDPVPRESTLEFVAGSHASRTWYMPRSFFDGRPLIFDEGTFEEVPDVEGDRDAHPIVGWELEPGDAVAFDMLTLHAAAGSRNRRRAFSVRLVGDALEHPLFPLLWPR
jgi:hypothetical protein